MLTRHNPQTDSNAHFIVQPKMGTKGHVVQPAPQRRVRTPHCHPYIGIPSSVPPCEQLGSLSVGPRRCPALRLLHSR